jgi:acetyltransferase-like isoleucine patch superfamily enzyme
VKIGERCIIKPFTYICDGVTIEDEVFVGPNVTFTNDKYPFLGSEWTLLETTVKRGATIGAGAVICPGLTIGEYALVGAGSVVTKNVPAHTWVKGNPAQPYYTELGGFMIPICPECKEMCNRWKGGSVCLCFRQAPGCSHVTGKAP